MRTNEERVAALHRRAKELKRERRAHQVRITQVGAVAACFAVIVSLAILMPDYAGSASAEGAAGGVRASIFSGGGALGLVVVGITAFLLGIAVTLFCFYLKKWQKEKEKDDEGDP